jgi:hypothetical protein
LHPLFASDTIGEIDHWVELISPFQGFLRGEFVAMLLASVSSPSFPRTPSRLRSVRFGENYRVLVVEDNMAIRNILMRKIKTTRSNSISQAIGVTKKDTIDVTGVSSLQGAKDAFEKGLESYPGQRPFHALVTDNDLSQGGEPDGTNHGIELLKWMQKTIPDLLKPWCSWMHSSGGDDIQQLAKEAGAQKFYLKGNGLQVIGPMVKALWEEIRNKENQEKQKQKAKEVEEIDNNAFKKNRSFRKTSIASIWPTRPRLIFSTKRNFRKRRFTR